MNKENVLAYYTSLVDLPVSDFDLSVIVLGLNKEFNLGLQLSSVKKSLETIQKISSKDRDKLIQEIPEQVKSFIRSICFSSQSSSADLPTFADENDSQDEHFDFQKPEMSESAENASLQKEEEILQKEEELLFKEKVLEKKERLLQEQLTPQLQSDIISLFSKIDEKTNTLNSQIDLHRQLSESIMKMKRELINQQREQQQHVTFLQSQEERVRQNSAKVKQELMVLLEKKRLKKQECSQLEDRIQSAHKTMSEREQNILLQEKKLRYERQQVELMQEQVQRQLQVVLELRKNVENQAESIQKKKNSAEYKTAIAQESLQENIGKFYDQLHEQANRFEKMEETIQKISKRKTAPPKAYLQKINQNLTKGISQIQKQEDSFEKFIHSVNIQNIDEKTAVLDLIELGKVFFEKGDMFQAKQTYKLIQEKYTQLNSMQKQSVKQKIVDFFNQLQR